ncbi:MAG: hypothetical protein WCC59_15070 [Terriglobales bacterium]
MKNEGNPSIQGRYFGPSDTVIDTTRAAILLGYHISESRTGCQAVRRYIVLGLIVARRLYSMGGNRISHYQISKLSVLDLKAKIQPQVEQTEPSD